MPTYQYACTECGHAFEQFQGFTEDALTECPECAGRLRKLYNAVGVVFKGSGFYRNDSRADGRPDGAGKESGSKEPASTESGSKEPAAKESGSKEPAAKGSGSTESAGQKAGASGSQGSSGSSGSAAKSA